MARSRVLYFTIVELAAPSNGGAICCRSHAESLQADEGIDLFVLAAARPQVEAGTLEYFREKGLRGAFVPLASVDPEKPSWMARRWPFPHEWEALGQDRLTEMTRRILRDFRPDAIVVDYLHSALYNPVLFESGLPVVLITLNREADFFRDQIGRGLFVNGRKASTLNALRFARVEKRLHRQASAVVAIGKHDVPREAKRTYVLSPNLPPSRTRWRYSGTNSVLFVGNTQHYPNAEAAEWLTQALAPELEKRAPDIRIKIVSRDPTVPEPWRKPNVTILGDVADEELTTLLATEDLSIAPIRNTYGAKLKVAEAMSFGSPLMASEAALSGVEFYSAFPPLRLDDPAGAADSIAAAIRSPDALTHASEAVTADHAKAFAAMQGRWTRLLRDVVAA